MLTLIVGLRGTGKSTTAQALIGTHGLAYDLDAIAGAFRLREPHEEYHVPSRQMANDFLFGFVTKANDYSENIVVIRTAPSVEEAERIAPDRIIWMTKQFIKRPCDREEKILGKISKLILWANENNIPVEKRNESPPVSFEL